jgi:hypothetical protein
LRPHLYIRFRLRLAGAGLKEAIASAKSSARVVALALGPVLFGLLAVLALPALYAPALGWRLGLLVVAVHGAVAALPVWLLRELLLPLAVQQWQRALPISRRLQLRAEAGVAGIVMLPLACLYAISAAFTVIESPPWLRPIWPLGLAALLLSMSISWLIATAILVRRAAPSPTGRRRAAPAIDSHRPMERNRLPRTLLLWHRLFWLPFWRTQRVIGLRQSALLMLCLASTAMWMWPAPVLPHGLLALCSGVSLVILTDRGDKAVRAQWQRIAATMASWPADLDVLARYARAASLIPALAVMALWAGLALAHHDALSARAGLLYIGVAALSQSAIVCLTRLGAEGRVILLALSMLMLIASGSELWN